MPYSNSQLTGSLQDKLNQAMELERQDRRAAGRSNWADLSPDWVRSKQLELNTQSVDPNQTTGGFKGVDYNYFTEMLKKQIEQGDPNQALYRQNLQGQINKGVDTSQERLKEQLAQSGMSRSGVATGAMANLEMGRADALGNAEVQLSAQDQAFRQNALAKLLGLQELGLNEMGQNRNYYSNMLGMEMSNDRFNKQMEYQKEQDKFNFWRDMMPGLIDAGGKAGVAAIAASDRRLKENISLVGQSPKGVNIYEFNYIGHPQKFRGAMADENPNATIKKNGIKYLDYSKIDVEFEAI